MYDHSRLVPDEVRQRVLQQAAQLDSPVQVGNLLIQELISARIDSRQVQFHDVKQLLVDAIRAANKNSPRAPCYAA